MKINEHRQALKLRNKGYSVKEIAKQLDVAKSTASLWVRDVALDGKAKIRLRSRVTAGQLAAAVAKRKIVTDREAYLFMEALPLGAKVAGDKDYGKLLCAMLYWCEGGKSPNGGMRFVNSDPKLVAKFLELLRSSFELDETKFRACIHLHGYHLPSKQLAFWSEITNIPEKQFIKPYYKPNTGKRIREGYQGCIAVRYYSSDLVRKLNAIAKAFISK